MRFAWNRAMADDSSPEPFAPTQPTAGELAAVQLLMADGEARICWIDTQGQRTSDWLNARSTIPVRGLASEGASDQPPDADAPAQELERGRILWVVPPTLPPNRHLRLHRRRVLVHLELDDYQVSGQAHVRPGADAVDQVLRGTRDLVPLTEVQVVSRADPGGGMALPVLIVNRTHVRRIAEEATHVSVPVPDPVDEADPRIALLSLQHAAPPTDVATPPSPGTADATSTPEPAVPAELSGVELLHAALTLLLEAGMIDVVEFQSIRARIPTPPTD